MTAGGLGGSHRAGLAFCARRSRSSPIVQRADSGNNSIGDGTGAPQPIWLKLAVLPDAPNQGKPSKHEAMEMFDIGPTHLEVDFPAVI